jgi:hypothetical protein
LSNLKYIFSKFPIKYSKHHNVERFKQVFNYIIYSYQNVAIFLWMITILATLQKWINKLYLIILGKIKTCHSKNIRHILCIENIIVKHLMDEFLIDIEFTKILGWFKQKQLVDLFMTWNFK